jgi:hypothetical protein
VPLADGFKSGAHPHTLHHELVRGAVTQRLVQALRPNDYPGFRSRQEFKQTRSEVVVSQKDKPWISSRSSPREPFSQDWPNFSINPDLHQPRLPGFSETGVGFLSASLIAWPNTEIGRIDL